MVSSGPARTPRTIQPHFTPFRLLREEMDDLFGRVSEDWDSVKNLLSFRPATDVSETAQALEIRVDVPGMKPDDTTVEVIGNLINISGDLREDQEEKRKMFHRKELCRCHSSEMLTLPCQVSEEKVQAEFRDGILTITLPKIEEVKSLKLKIKVDRGGTTQSEWRLRRS